MIEYDEIRFSIQSLKNKIDELTEALELDKLEAQLKEIEEQTAREGFWNDTENSQKVLQKQAALKSKYNSCIGLQTRYEDALSLIEMAEEAEDPSFVDELTESYSSLAKDLDAALLQTLLSGEYDDSNAILTLHAGAGGTEAQDWVEMLYRMYMHWAEGHGYKFKQLDCLPGDDAGIKSVSFLIEGENAFGYMKGEGGVHRLVRVSPFDASGRRHTSFASLEVIPEINDDVNVEINPDDIRIDTYRASGAGGQHVNKTSSAIRITHLPTGIVVACQNERSQHQNKDMAMKMLKSKLLEIKIREHYDKIEDIKGDQMQIAWGSQIRSYVFMPYTLAKDHRTGYEMGNINAVMDGDIDGFINAYLKALSQGTIQ